MSLVPSSQSASLEINFTAIKRKKPVLNSDPLMT